MEGLAGLVKQLLHGGNMARYAVIKKDKVTNVIEVNNASDYPTADTLVQSNTAGVGDSYIGGIFTPSPIINTPNWSGWATDMAANAAYNSFFNSFLGGVLATATNMRSLGRYDNYLDLLATRGDDPKMYTTFTSRWNAIVLIPLINLPSNGNIVGWNTIGSNNFMPFTFSSPSAQMALT